MIYHRIDYYSGAILRRRTIAVYSIPLEVLTSASDGGTRLVALERLVGY